jgi:hypothetical protein
MGRNLPSLTVVFCIAYAIILAVVITAIAIACKGPNA